MITNIRNKKEMQCNITLTAKIYIRVENTFNIVAYNEIYHSTYCNIIHLYS